MSAPSEKATDFNNNGEVVRPGISSAFLKAQDIRHVDAVEAESLLGFRPRNNGSGIWIPYHDSFKPGPLIVNGRPFGRLRLDKPTTGAKYLSPKEGGAQLYVPINAGPFGKQLVIAEGEFKANALCEAGNSRRRNRRNLFRNVAGKIHPRLGKTPLQMAPRDYLFSRRC